MKRFLTGERNALSWWKGLLVAFLVASAQAQGTPSAAAPKTGVASAAANAITFVQLTDMHLFDAGKKSERKSDAERERQDNRDALHWAIEQINRLTETGRAVDFVVFTGDFGLELVRSSAEGPPCNGSDEENFKRAKQRGWPKLASPDEAAEEVANEFRILRVAMLYMLPGNNDLIAEDPCDLVRYKSFVALLRIAMRGKGPQIVDLTEPRNARIEYNGFRLIGFNSASFKQRDVCQNKPGPGCPEDEIRRLSTVVPADSRGLQYVIFTHIPDLLDPFRDQQSSPLRRAWRIPKDQNDIWNRVAAQSNVAAIFAGHFHDSDRLFYAIAGDQTPLSVDPGVSRKTWVAPPLAIKYQNPKSLTARGLMLVRLQRIDGPMGANALVSVSPFWYTAPGSRSPSFYIGRGLLILVALITTVVLAIFAIRWTRIGPFREVCVKNENGKSVQQTFGDLLTKTIRLKEFALKNGYTVDPSIVGELNVLAQRYPQAFKQEPSDWVVEPEDSTRLDKILERLTSITFPTTVDFISIEPESPEYKRFKRALVVIGVTALVFEIVAFSLIEKTTVPLPLSNSVMAIFLGLLGSVSYSLFNVLRVVPPQAFNPKDEYYSYARLILGLLLGWVFYFAFAMDAFADLPRVIAEHKANPTEAFRLLVPFLAGYSTKFVIGIIERAITALEVALGIEDKRAVRKEVLGFTNSQKG